jgi:hypothetical protein
VLSMQSTSVISASKEITICKSHCVIYGAPMYFK